MSAQIRLYLKRLKKPSVIISLASQIVSLMVLVGMNVNQEAVISFVTAGCTVCTAMGILSNPDTKKNGYGDDILKCSNCGKDTQHVEIAGEMVCKDCGTKYEGVKA